MTSHKQLQQKKKELRAKQRRAKRRESSEQVIVIRDLPGIPRMSEVISHLAEPIVELFGNTADDVEDAVRWTVLVWNLLQFPEETRDREFANAAAKACGQDFESISVLRLVYNLVDAGKRRYYPHINRIIHNVKFRRESDSSVYFDVMHSSTSGKTL